MPTSNSTPLINGHRYSAASARVKISYDGGEFEVGGIQKIDYEDALEVGAVKGQGGRKIGRTRGAPSYTVSATFLRSDWNLLQGYLATVGAGMDPQQGVGEVPANISVIYQDEGVTFEDTIVGCRFVKRKTGVDTGTTDASIVETDIDAMNLLLNGVPIIP